METYLTPELVALTFIVFVILVVFDVCWLQPRRRKPERKKNMDKIKTLIESRIKASDCTHCFAVPGGQNMIDLVHPVTGRTVIFGRTLEETRQEPGYEKAELMLVGDFLRDKAATQDTPITWEETTEDKFHEMLEVLPPAAMTDSGFLVGEPWDHHALTGAPRYAAYKESGGKYYVASRPLTRKEFKTA